MPPTKDPADAAEHGNHTERVTVTLTPRQARIVKEFARDAMCSVSVIGRIAFMKFIEQNNDFHAVAINNPQTNGWQAVPFDEVPYQDKPGA